MSGYWNNSEETDNSFTDDGFFKTGDIATINENGFLNIVDRKKDMIISSGYNVYPNEIEDVVVADGENLLNVLNIKKGELDFSLLEVQQCGRCDSNNKSVEIIVNEIKNEITEGGDVAVGSRYVNNQVNVVNWDIKRLLLSYFASKYVRFITRIPVFDTTAGFVCYRRKVLECIQLDKINAL